MLALNYRRLLTLLVAMARNCHRAPVPDYGPPHAAARSTQCRHGWSAGTGRPTIGAVSIRHTLVMCHSLDLLTLLVCSPFCVIGWLADYGPTICHAAQARNLPWAPRT
ncbi:unnamed protein product [Staurois parvus]|uniref:Secreted protein n=1 Tax=Staurois parvus TaxID=386267 RepID=A0ABN9CD64_9NEOB|nr:unnamed protein product [Staurois parvus]